MPTSRGVDPHGVDASNRDIICVPASDGAFRARVDEVMHAIDPASADWIVAAEAMLRERYPEMALVARDPIAGYGLQRAWYALRDGHSGARTRRRILIVDDEPSLQAVITESLQSDRFEVRTAGDGAAALLVIHDWQPDLILLDLEMPIMNGTRFAERYHDSPPPHAPLIVISGGADAEAQASRIGARSVISKPFDLDTLDRLIDRYA